MNKITKEWIQDKIVKAECMLVPDSTVTICNIVLENGFSVRGESACVDPTLFNKQVGEDLAYKDAFNKIWQLEGYLLAEGLWLQRECPEVQDFGWAVRQLKADKRVARTGWNGKGMWLSLSGSKPRDIRAKHFWSSNNVAFAKNSGGSATVLPCITMKTADDKILMGWLASQTDMLAEDWVIVG